LPFAPSTPVQDLPPAKKGKDAEIWAALNERQQAVLRAIYEADQANEEGRKADRAQGHWDDTPATVWRWLLHATLSYGDTDLKANIRAAKALDEGIGSTYAALERRGIIEIQAHARGTVYEGKMMDIDRQWYVFVKLTPLGRAVARAGDPAYKPEKKLPTGTLRERQWQALEALYQAGPEGLKQDDYGNYGGFSWEWTILRLRDYKAGSLAKEAGGELLATFPVVRRADPRIVITDFGREYYEQNRERYAELYPDLANPGNKKR
jgi:hypothetical protein